MWSLNVCVCVCVCVCACARVRVCACACDKNLVLSTELVKKIDYHRDLKGDISSTRLASS